jgi:hypothetical protein
MGKRYRKWIVTSFLQNKEEKRNLPNGPRLHRQAEKEKASPQGWEDAFF